MALRDGYRLDQSSGALRDGYVLDQGSAALRDGYDNILSTGGSSVSVGFRLDTLANLQVFATVMTGNAGAWEVISTSGTTVSASTGPGTNSPGPYTYSETSSGTVTTIEEVSRAVLNVVSMWPRATGRTLRLQASIMGDWDTDGEGMVVQTQPTGGTWTDVRVVNGWLYGNTYVVGDTIIPYQGGRAFTCVRNGGWGDFDFDIPDDADEVRIANRTMLGLAYQHDMALWSAHLRND